MNSFTYWNPTKIVFGVNAAKQTGIEIKAFGGTKALVFYGKGSAIENGALGTVINSISAEGIQYTCVGGVQPNPLAEFAQQVVDENKNRGFDFVIGVGGASVLDTAKAVAHGLATPDVPVWDYFSGEKALRASLPVGAVITIAAAGSETSNSAVLTNKSTGIKRGLRSQLNRPAFAILDPVFTYTLSPRQTACGVTDILMHTLDRYFAPDTDNEITDEIAEALMRAVIENGRIVQEKPHDYKARSELMWAGSLSHNGLTGLGQTEDFAVHQLSHALSARYDTPHGESLSALWRSWAEYVFDKNPLRFAQFARKVWGITTPDDETAARAGIESTVDYFRYLGMPTTITEAVGELTNEDLDILTNLCTYHGTRTIGSFKVLNADAIRAIYRAAATLQGVGVRIPTP